MKVATTKGKIWKTKTVETPLNTISSVYFRYARLLTGKFSRTSTIHPGIFGGPTLLWQCISADEHYICSNTNGATLLFDEIVLLNFTNYIPEKLPCSSVHWSIAEKDQRENDGDKENKLSASRKTKVRRFSLLFNVQ